jgi:hypothetical protein
MTAAHPEGQVPLINITSSVVIYRPVGMVFDFISSATNDFEWQYATLASGPTKPEATRTGGSFRTIGHLMGHRMQSTYEVTHFEADRRYGFKSISGPLHSHTMYTLETEKGQTRVQVSTQASPANVLQNSERVVERFMQKQLREDLAMLKSILEARSSLPGRAD